MKMFLLQFMDSLYRALISKGEAQEKANSDVLGCLDLIEGALGEGPYFGGQEFGFMDIAFIPFTTWFHILESIGNFKMLMDSQFPWLKAWIEKCMERESVKKVLILETPCSRIDKLELTNRSTRTNQSTS